MGCRSKEDRKLQERGEIKRKRGDVVDRNEEVWETEGRRTRNEAEITGKKLEGEKKERRK